MRAARWRGRSPGCILGRGQRPHQEARSDKVEGNEDMTTRRDFIRTTVAAGIGGATLAQAPLARAASPSSGPKQMPRGLTLLSIAQGDGSETLGVKLPNGILDVAAAAKALNMEAPASVEEMLAAGN